MVVPAGRVTTCARATSPVKTKITGIKMPPQRSFFMGKPPKLSLVIAYPEGPGHRFMAARFPFPAVKNGICNADTLLEAESGAGVVSFKNQTASNSLTRGYFQLFDDFLGDLAGAVEHSRLERDS